MFKKQVVGAMFACGLAAIGLMSVTPAAHAQQTFGGNVGFNWTIPGAPASGLTEISFPITLNPATARMLGNYAAWQFQFTNSGGAYAGLQPTHNADGRARIHGTFSSFISGSTSSDPNCSNGADGGPGVSCGVDFYGTYGHRYVVVVSRTGPDTWTGTAWNTTVTGAGIHLGTFTLPAGSGNLRGSESGFVENWHTTSCASVPKIDVSLGKPYSQPAGLTGDVGGAVEYGNCLGQENYSAVGTGEGIRIQRGQPTGAIIGLNSLCVDVRNGSNASGTPVQAYYCNGTASQQWISASSSTLQAYGKCMDISGGSTADGARIQLYDCNGSAAQVWITQGNGALLNPQSSKCLDIPNAGGAGTQLQLYTCNGTAAQRWSLNN